MLADNRCGGFTFKSVLVVRESQEEIAQVVWDRRCTAVPDTYGP